MHRALPLALLLVACDRDPDRTDDSDPVACDPEDADCCCPAPGTGIDCMPAIDECTQWRLEQCDVYCASH